MVELTKRPLVPFYIGYGSDELNCIFHKDEIYICASDLKRVLGKDFPSKRFHVLGMKKNIVGFAPISELEKGGAPKTLISLLASISPDEGRDALNGAFFI